MAPGKDKPLATPAWCRKCKGGPYTWRSGLRFHVLRIHPELSERERSELVASSVQPPKP